MNSLTVHVLEKSRKIIATTNGARMINFDTRLNQHMTESQKSINSEELAAFIIEGIREKKGHDIVRIDLRNIHNAISDFFVICHANSDRQVDAIATSIDETVRKHTGDRPNTIEGRQNAEWVLMDYVDVVVHVFQEKLRHLYALEDLWADAAVEQMHD